MTTIRVPREIREFASIFAAAGWRCHIVGGAVRDSLIGRPVSDYDAATDARPEDIIACFRNVIPTGIKHGTVTVIHRGYKIETTTYRTESEYSDARRPDRIEYSSSISEDLARRDFTINAMAFDPLSGELLDLHDGMGDLRRKLVRTVGLPSERFSEDGLRPMRAIRFATQLEFGIEKNTYDAIGATLDRLALVSMERIRDEFAKIMLSPRPSTGIALMEKSGILGLLLPELSKCRDVLQKGMHDFDVLDHCMFAADAAPATLVLRLSALFHDIGKPASMKLGEDGLPTFHRHEEISAIASEAILKRLRFPGSVIKEVSHLVAHHMFNYGEEWSDAAVRRFVAKVGAEHIDSLFELRLADGTGMSGRRANPIPLVAFRERIEDVLARDNALSLKDLAIGGEDLARLGIPKGPVMGRVLAELLETVLDDPEQNETKTLARIAGKLGEKYGCLILRDGNVQT